LICLGEVDESGKEEFLNQAEIDTKINFIGSREINVNPKLSIIIPVGIPCLGETYLKKIYGYS